MEKLVIDRKTHVKCDICGSEKEFKDTGYVSINPIDYGWSKLKQTKSTFFGRRIKDYNLCPLCSAKFGKLVKEVEVITVNGEEIECEMNKEFNR